MPSLSGSVEAGLRSAISDDGIDGEVGESRNSEFESRRLGYRLKGVSVALALE